MICQLEERQLITACEAQLMRAAISQQALSVPVPQELKDAARARILKSMLTVVARQQREPGALT